MRVISKHLMLCPVCSQEIETDAMREHIRHEVYDKQYGVRELGLGNALYNLTNRLHKLEDSHKTAKRKEIEKIRNDRPTSVNEPDKILYDKTT